MLVGDVVDAVVCQEARSANHGLAVRVREDSEFQIHSPPFGLAPDLQGQQKKQDCQEDPEVS